MKFDSPAKANPTDQLKVIGRPTDRIEGKLKTTGAATYAYEHTDFALTPAYGFVVGAGIAKGRIARMDVAAAKAAAGVLAVVTAENAGPLSTGEFYVDKALAGPNIDHYHQAIALVVAETLEQARAAASLVRVDYVRSKGGFDLAASGDMATPPSPVRIARRPRPASAISRAPMRAHR